MSEKKGIVEVIAGPMSCGKTEEMIRRLTRLSIGRKNFMVIKPSVDTRFSREIKSRNGSRLPATSVDCAREILTQMRFFDNLHTVAIDEAQFFNSDIVPIVKEIKSRGINVLIGGLPIDFRGEPFGQMGNLMVIANNILLLTAICMKCGEEATLTQRLTDGKPSFAHEPLVIVDDQKDRYTYEARCTDCYHLEIW